MDKNYNIRHELLEFGRCEQLTDKAIGTEIIRVLEKSNLVKKTAVEKDMIALITCHLKQRVYKNK